MELGNGFPRRGLDEGWTSLREWSWGMGFLVDGWTRAGHRLGNGVREWI
jgi:hypothetical protein